MSVRVRYAPSPTGALHPGSARTVLFNYLFARANDGTFILRIEDTDQKRSGEGSLRSILDGIRWLGLPWDEGPEVGGPHAPYFQSERLPQYANAVQRLLDDQHAYLCFCTPERLQALRQGQEKAHLPTRYDRHCLNLDAREVERRLAAGERPVVRMKVPDGQTVVEDLLRGQNTIANSSQDDQVLLKSDGFPTYHLAATVDDHLMEITHVIRGDEWLGSFPKHVMLYSMLGWTPPAFAHVPVVLGPDKSKLSKRHGAAAVLEYRDLGYLPEAMINFLAFLGWSPGTEQEFFDLEGLVAAFDLARVQVSPAVFDIARLDHVNGHHIRALPTEEFALRLEPFTPKLSPTLRVAAAPLVQERIQRLAEATELLDFLTTAPTDLPDELVPADKDAVTTTAMLQEVRLLLESEEVGEGLEPSLRALAERLGWKVKDLFMAVRIALTGRRITPPLLPSAALLGQAECLRRVDWAIGQLARRRERAPSAG